MRPAPHSAPRDALRGPSRGGFRALWASTLVFRIFAVNVLPLLILLGGVLYLGQYEDRLVENERLALREQAGLFGGALGEGAVVWTPDQRYELNNGLATQMVRRLGEASQVRIRLFDAKGALVVDNALLNDVAVERTALPLPVGQRGLWRMAVDGWHGVLDALPASRKLKKLREQPEPTAKAYPDAALAIEGQTQATAWANAEGHIVLTAAAPVQRLKEVMGAVLLSRERPDIEEAVRDVREDILKIFAATLAVTVLMSYYLAVSLGRPIRRLASSALSVRTGTGKRPDMPDFSHRHDEIGDLSLALNDMTRILWDRMGAIERFAADVAHEIKNPLTSLRSAVETAARVPDPVQQKRLLAIVQDDVQRLDRLISDISNASRLDAELSRAESAPVDVASLLRMLEDIDRTTKDDAAPETPRVVLDLAADTKLTVSGIESRLVQVFHNLISNALSFSPPGGRVVLHGRRHADQIIVEVDDDGPGVPEAKLKTIFDRFYSDRPKSERFGQHSGLGLAISKQIIDAHGGQIYAENRRDGEGRVLGARFTVRLKAA